jgi:hypothetical protein
MFRRSVVAAAAAVVSLLACPPPGAAQTIRTAQHYVALGDSCASGPGIPELRADDGDAR